MTSKDMENTIMLRTRESKLKTKLNSRNNIYQINVTSPL